MRNLFLVHVIECEQDLLDQSLGVDFWNGAVLSFRLQEQVVKESAIGDQFRNYIVMVVIVKQLINLHDSRVVQLLEKFHFILQVFLLAISFDVLLADELDCAINLGI